MAAPIQPATDIIKGGMCISGMYDLTPVRLSARSRYIAFNDATVAALSPLRHLDRLHAPLVVAYGTCESPEFQRQNREFAAAVKASGKRVELLVGEHWPCPRRSHGSGKATHGHGWIALRSDGVFNAAWKPDGAD